MKEYKRQNLSANERKIVELTLQGESQIDIANKLDVAPSTVYRTLRREHIKDMITSATRGLMSSLVQKMMQNYENCLLYTSPSPRDQRGSRMPSSA